MSRSISILVVILLIVLPYAFMTAYSFYAAGKIFRRGRKGWAVWAAVTAFFGIGWVLAVRGLAKRPAVIDMDLGTRCPSCGSEKGYREEKIVDTKNGADLIGILEFMLRTSGALLCILLIASAAVYLIHHIEDFVFYSVAIMTIAIAGYHLVRPILYYIRTEKEKTDEFYCGKCGHIWNKFTPSDTPAELG